MSEMTEREKRPRGGISFRTRLSWGLILVVAFAMTSVGLYAFYRMNVTNSYLTEQVSANVVELTENDLTLAVRRNATDLDEFFDTANDSIATLGAVVQSILIREQTQATERAWDARQDLTPHPSGGWDNDNDEPGSIFVQPRAEISDALAAELNAVKRIDFFAPSILQKNPDMVALFYGSAEGATMYYPNIDLANVLPAGFDVTKRDWFENAAPVLNPSRKLIWSTPYPDAAKNGLVVTNSYPIYDASGRFRGVIGADFQLVKIADMIASFQFGQTGYAFLLDGDGRVIAMSSDHYADFGLEAKDLEGEAVIEPILNKVPIDVYRVLSKMVTSQSGMRTATMNGVEKYVAYQPIPSVGYNLGIVVPVSETQGSLLLTRERLAIETRQTYLNILTSMAALLLVTLLVSRWMGNTLARPLSQLTETATRLAEGDLNAKAQARTRDEFGVLANAFNVMAGRLRELVGSLEARVAERTLELEKASALSEKRASELKTVSEVARAISTEVDLENLLALITNLVSEAFGFYHVGVFLLDQLNRNAVLRSANSPGGKRMIERGHKLPIGQVGIVGNVAATAKPRIALDVGEDAAFFNNPDLPETRSEMALPLSLRGQIIGVLDVQSRAANAFTQSDAETLSILADQIAIAIENARLLAQSKQALSEAQMLYGEYLGRAWEQRTAWKTTGFHYTPGAGRMLEEPVEWEEVKTALSSGRASVSELPDSTTALAVPIKLRNQVIGALDIRSNEADHAWSDEEIAMIEAIAERLGLALENARLFEETSGRAAREHAVAEIASRIRETNDPQAMIRTAIQELQRVLNVTRVEIIPQVVSANLPGREGGPQAG